MLRKVYGISLLFWGGISDDFQFTAIIDVVYKTYFQLYRPLNVVK